MAMQIPEYVAERGLDTERSTIPNIPAMDNVGRALENLGSSFAEFGAHLKAKEKQKQDTNDAIAYEGAVQKNQQSSYDAKNNNEDPAGEGMYDAGQAAIDRNNAEALAKMSPENQKIYASKLAINKSDNGMWLETQQHEQSRGHYADVTKGIVGNKALDVGVNPHKWQEHLDDSYKFIDGLPNLYFNEKEALKKQAYEALANGKIQGQIDRDPNGAKQGLGVTGQSTTSLSGAKVPSGSGNAGMRAKQHGFVWHELTGSGAHGGGSEAAVYKRLLRATSIEAATAAGISYERPAGWTWDNPQGGHNFQGRLNNAKRVLAGKASQEAMQARAYYESKGLTPIQASGLVGNLMGESGDNLNPHSQNDNDAGPGRHSNGIAQWNDGPKNKPSYRKANMLAFTGIIEAEMMPDPSGLSKQEIDPAYEQMPAEWRIIQLNRADNALNSANSARTNEAKARVTQTAQDEYTATVTNGRYEGTKLTKQDYYDAIPNDVGKAEESFGAYERSMAEASKIHSFQNMTLNELSSQREKTLRMVGVGPGAAEQAEFQKAELAALDVAVAKIQDPVKIAYEAQQELMKGYTVTATERAKMDLKLQEERRVQEAADLKAAVERRIKDDPASFETTSMYQGALLSPEVFQKIWPGKEGENRFKDYMLSVQGAKMRSGFADAPTPKLLAGKAELDKTIKGAAGQDTSALINEAVLTQNAIEKELKARDADPAGYVLQNNSLVADAFIASQQDPTNKSKSEYAIKIMLSSQRYLGIAETKLAPLPQFMVDNITGPFNNPDANVLNATGPLINALELTTDKSVRAAIVRQVTKAGVKSNVSEGLIAYFDGRKPEAMRLLNAARIDDTPKGSQDDVKNSEINTKLNEILSPALNDRAATEWGNGYQDSGQRTADLEKLGFSYVKKAMFNGATVKEAITQFSKDIFGDKIPVVRELRNGMALNFPLPPDEDPDIIADGLASQFKNIEKTIKAQIQGPVKPLKLGDKEDPNLQAEINKENMINNWIQTGVWISYDDGFAYSTSQGLLRNADGTFYTVTMEEARNAGIEVPVQIQPRGKGAPSGQ